MDSLVVWADLGHLLVAWHLDVDWHLYWHSNWDMDVLIFWDAHILLLDHVVRDHFLAVDWHWDGLVVVARFLDNNWDLLVDIAVDSAAALVASIN